jgi:hypothetical protein
MLRGSIPGRGKLFLSSPKRPDRHKGPFSLLFSGYRGRERRLRPEADRSLPCSGKVMNEWNCTSTPVPCLSGVQRDLTFFFLALCRSAGRIM